MGVSIPSSYIVDIYSKLHLSKTGRGAPGSVSPLCASKHAAQGAGGGEDGGYARRRRGEECVVAQVFDTAAGLCGIMG